MRRRSTPAGQPQTLRSEDKLGGARGVGHHYGRALRAQQHGRRPGRASWRLACRLHKEGTAPGCLVQHRHKHRWVNGSARLPLLLCLRGLASRQRRPLPIHRRPCPHTTLPQEGRPLPTHQLRRVAPPCALPPPRTAPPAAHHRRPRGPPA